MHCKERYQTPEEVLHVPLWNVNSFMESDGCGFFTNSGSTVALVNICTNESAYAFVVPFSHVSLPAFPLFYYLPVASPTTPMLPSQKVQFLCTQS